MTSTSLFRLPLLPISRLYGAISAANIAARERRAFRSSLPVISIGNLSVGGTGKTPLVLWLLEHLQEHTPAIVLSRGYARQERGDRIWRAGEPAPDPDVFGDEPALIARAAGCRALAVGEDRAPLLEELQQVFPDATAVLDDGFQHRQLARDLDVVIIDDRTARLPYPLPAGVLREPPEALSRADVIVATSPRAQQWAQENAATGIPVLRGGMREAGIRKWQGGEMIEPRPALLVSGIAQPVRIRSAALALNVPVVGELRFRDHYRYRDEDAVRLMKSMRRSSAEILLTTSKDAVKLERLPELLPVLHVVDARFELEDAALMHNIIAAVIASRHGER